MTEPWLLIGWVFVFIMIAIVGSWIYVVFKKIIGQLLTNRKRNRAHAGKLTCEVSGCSKIAGRVTPNGYYCEDHWGANARSDRASWGYRLNHAYKRGE